MDGKELDELTEDIRQHGLRHPIVVVDEQILDGRNRLRACEAAGVLPDFQDWDGTGDPVAYVISVNLRRRHLSESQRAMVAARAKKIFESSARERQRVGGRTKLPANLPEAGESRAKAAALLNVSARSVENAARVLRDGVPELARAVEEGKIAVSTAATIAEAPRR